MYKGKIFFWSNAQCGLNLLLGCKRVPTLNCHLNRVKSSKLQLQGKQGRHRQGNDAPRMPYIKTFPIFFKKKKTQKQVQRSQVSPLCPYSFICMHTLQIFCPRYHRTTSGPDLRHRTLSNIIQYNVLIVRCPRKYM